MVRQTTMQSFLAVSRGRFLLLCVAIDCLLGLTIPVQAFNLLEEEGMIPESAYFLDYSATQLGMLLRQPITGSSHHAYGKFPWWQALLGAAVAFCGISIMAIGVLRTQVPHKLCQTADTVRRQRCPSLSWAISHHKPSLSDDDASSLSSAKETDDENDGDDLSNENDHRLDLHLPLQFWERAGRPITSVSERGTAASQSRRRRGRRRAAAWSRRARLWKSMSWREDEDASTRDFSVSSFDPLLLEHIP